MNATAATETKAHCLRCGRTLRSAASIARGYGRTCRTKVTAAEQAADLHDFKPEQIAHAEELIEDGAIVQLRGRIYLAVSSDGTETYRTTATGQCNCRAGLRGIRCFHTLAAQIIQAA